MNPIRAVLIACRTPNRSFQERYYLVLEGPFAYPSWTEDPRKATLMTRARAASYSSMAVAPWWAEPEVEIVDAEKELGKFARPAPINARPQTDCEAVPETKRDFGEFKTINAIGDLDLALARWTLERFGA